MSASDRLGASTLATRDFTGRDTTTARTAAHISRTVIYGVDDDAELRWQDQALCAQADPEAWFPERGGSTRDPKRVCARCPVREPCLEFALKYHERFGVYGGLSERERRRLEDRFGDDVAAAVASTRHQPSPVPQQKAA